MKIEDLERDAFIAQAESIAILMNYPQWEAYMDLLRLSRQGALEELSQLSDHTEFRYWQGVAHAFNEMIDRPRDVIAAASSIVQQEEADTKEIRTTIRALTRTSGDDL